MIIRCPTCNTEYDCAPGKYECECSAKFRVADNGKVIPDDSISGTTSNEPTVDLDIDKTIPPHQRPIEQELSEATIPGRRERKPDGRFEVGELILGRYKVLSELGQGGMGVVYECFDEIAGIKVALKSLPPELSHNRMEMEDIRENFQLVYNLHHPNIASYNTLERDNSNGNYFLVMECVSGENLRGWIKRKRRENGLTLETVLPVIQQVASALDYAHKQKIVHRDIKPSNIMIDAEGQVKVLDFGLAAQIRTSMTRVSKATGETSGTAPYMAPEQWNGKAQGAASDQYALAVMTYEMLAGCLPFESSDMAVLQQAVLNAIPDLIEGLPAHAQAALMRGLAKAPRDRFGSCAEFAAELWGEGKTFTPKQEKKAAVPAAHTPHVIPVAVPIEPEDSVIPTKPVDSDNNTAQPMRTPIVETGKGFDDKIRGKHILFVACGIACVVLVLGILFFSDSQPLSQNEVSLVEKEINALKVSIQTAQTKLSRIDRMKERYEIQLMSYWNTDRDGEPETELRNLVNDAAQRAKANLQTLGTVRTSSINSELSYADLDFTVVDEYDKVIQFFAEIEKCTPRLSWRRVELRVESTRARAVTGPGALQNNATTSTTSPVQKIRATGQVRVIKYSAIGNTAASTTTVASMGVNRNAVASLEPPAAASATKTQRTSVTRKAYDEMLRERDDLKAKLDQLTKEVKACEKLKEKMEKTASISAGDPMLLNKLYDLSLVLPEDTLVTQFRFNDGNCDLNIQTLNRNMDLSQRLHFPYWKISRIQQRIVSNTIITYNVNLVRAEDAQTQSTDIQRTLSENEILTIVARNIFNTERVPDAPANKSNRNSQQQIRADMTLVGTYTIGDSLGAIILQRLQGNSQQQLKALQLKEYEQYQASSTHVTAPKKKNAEDSSSDGKAGTDDEPTVIDAGNTTISANNVFRQHLKVGDTTVTGYKLVEVTKTTAVLTKGTERIELTLLTPAEATRLAREKNIR